MFFKNGFQSGMGMKNFLIVVNNKEFLQSHRMHLVEKISDYFENTHIVTVDMDASNKWFYISNINFFSYLYSLVKSIIFIKKYDVIHVISPKAILLFMVFNFWRKNQNVVLSFSGFGWLRKYFLGRKKIIGLTVFKLLFVRFSGQIIVQNAFDLSLCEGFCVRPQQINMIKGSGFDFDAAKINNLINKPLPEKTVFLFASRLLYSKGIMMFCEAAKNINAIYPDIKFLIAGHYAPSNLSSIKETDFDVISKAPYLNYFGHVDDINTLMTTVTSVVLPSTYGEGLPKILIEAAALGRIVITNDHPGCSDAVINNVTGFLCTPNNQNELEEKMISVHLEKQRREQMSKEAAKFALEKFDVKDVVKKHFEIYEQVLNG